jgi:hypothetical protein
MKSLLSTATICHPRREGGFAIWPGPSTQLQHTNVGFSGANFKFLPMASNWPLLSVDSSGRNVTNVSTGAQIFFAPWISLEVLFQYPVVHGLVFPFVCRRPRTLRDAWPSAGPRFMTAVSSQVPNGYPIVSPGAGLITPLSFTLNSAGADRERAADDQRCGAPLLAMTMELRTMTLPPSSQSTRHRSVVPASPSGCRTAIQQ